MPKHSGRVTLGPKGAMPPPLPPPHPKMVGTEVEIYEFEMILAK